MIICCDEHSRYDFISPIRYNHRYANRDLLAEHRELICVLTKSVGGEISELRNRRFKGFEVCFWSLKDTEKTILERTQIAVANVPGAMGEVEPPFSNYIHMWALPASEAFDAYLRGKRIDDGLMRAIWRTGNN